MGHETESTSEYHRQMADGGTGGGLWVDALQRLSICLLPTNTSNSPQLWPVNTVTSVRLVML